MTGHSFTITPLKRRVHFGYIFLFGYILSELEPCLVPYLGLFRRERSTCIIQPSVQLPLHSKLITLCNRLCTMCAICAPCVQDVHNVCTMCPRCAKYVQDVHDVQCKMQDTIFRNIHFTVAPCVNILTARYTVSPLYNYTVQC